MKNKGAKLCHILIIFGWILLTDVVVVVFFGNCLFVLATETPLRISPFSDWQVWAGCDSCFVEESTNPTSPLRSVYSIIRF